MLQVYLRHHVVWCVALLNDNIGRIDYSGIDEAMESLECLHPASLLDGYQDAVYIFIRRSDRITLPTFKPLILTELESSSPSTFLNTA